MPSPVLKCSIRTGIVTALALILGAGAAAAQTGSIEGTVRHSQNASLIEGAQVTVVGTALSARTDANGYYRIDNVPAGTHSVRVARLGYNPVTATNARVAAGLPFTVNLELSPAIINLDAIVVTGTLGETQRGKLAFTVDVVTMEDLPVVQVDALTMIQGKVAGATVVSASGRPGSAPAILLRGPTSINSAGRSQEPLYVVDGVILGSSMADIDALDIESIEIVKGAAAASLFGSRAANGVIQITTRRGAGLADDELRFTVRTEYGGSQLPGAFDLTRSHGFLMTADGSKFVNQDGTSCDYLLCDDVQLAGQRVVPGTPDSLANEWNTFQNQAWPGTTYDQVDRFFRGGAFMQQYVAASGRSGGTNFHSSFSNIREEGVMPGDEGFRRNNFRLNVDSRMSDKFKAGASMFYSYSRQDIGEGPLFDLTRSPAGVDLTQLASCYQGDPCEDRDQPRLLPDGTQDPNDVWLRVDPFNEESENPLYTALNDNDIARRGRFLASANMRFRPVDWLTLSGTVSYDRLDYRRNDLVFKGYKTITPSPNTNLGNLYRYHSLTEAFNASVDVTVSKRFGDLATRTQFRYLGEWDDNEWTSATGRQFAVANVPTFNNTLADEITATSGLQPRRADGYFTITNWEYKDRYILDALVRNDGSSLFGSDQRRQWYYRLAGAWRVSEDFRLPGVDELKIRYAYGTAGGRPRFSAQYETYSVSGGIVSPVTLGNKDLKPEFSGEQEAGIDALLFGRVALTVNYAKTVTEDQILNVPLPAYSGFGSQWQNAGTLESNTWEMSLDMQLMQSRSFDWSARVLFDRTRQEITALNVPDYTYGDSEQGLGSVFFARAGEQLGQFYGMRYATSCADLLGGAPCGDFALNDDGLFVWVGSGGSLGNPQWGTTATDPFGFLNTNQTLKWGTPFYGWGIDRVSGDTTNFLPIGKTQPDYSLSLSTNLRWKGLTLYALVQSVQGFNLFNEPQQWSIFKGFGGLMDQAGVPENDQKPLGYYNALYGVSGLGAVNFFLEDGSFTKLREVSLRYRFDRNALSGVGFLSAFDGIAISLVGRNLITWTNYNGYDPDTGEGGGTVGSAAINRVDGYNYPKFRTFTAAIELNF